MKIIDSLKRAHKWIAVLVVIQLLLWIISGLVFSFIKHKEVGGNFIFRDHQKSAVHNSASFAAIAAQYPTAKNISLLSLLDELVFKVQLENQTHLINAKSLKPVLIDQALIKKIALASYQGAGQILNVNLETTRNDENRKFTLPSWKVVFDDKYKSHIYFSAVTAEYQGIRTDNWRIFDFFMMLHFMDYGERGNFNNPLIILFASLSLLFSLSGILLVYSSFSASDFSQLWYRLVDNQMIKIVIQDQFGQNLKLKVSKDTTLLDTLLEHEIAVESECGGGGICGTCRVKIDNIQSCQFDDVSEHTTLSDDELKKGYRLACQLPVTEKLSIVLDKEIKLSDKGLV